MGSVSRREQTKAPRGAGRPQALPIPHPRDLSVLFLDHSPTIAWMKDHKGRHVYLSKAFEKRFGVRLEDWRGRTDTEVWPPAVAAQFRRNDRTVLRTGRPLKVIEETVTRDGRRTSWLNLKFPFRDGAGNRFVGGIGLDITGTRQAETDQRLAKERLETHMANSPLAIVEFDPHYRIIRWSGAAERMFGWRAREVMGKAISDLRWVHEDDAARVARLSAEMLSGRQASNTHANRNYRKDGTVIYCEWHNSAIYDDQGRLTSVFSQVLDVTTRRQNEAMLEAAEAVATRQSQRLRALLDALPDGMALIDENGAITSWNAAFDEIWKGPRPPSTRVADYTMYRAWRVENGHLLKPHEWAAAQAVQRGRTVLNQHLQIQRFDGTRAFVLNSAAPIRDAEGRITGGAVAIRDVTGTELAERLDKALTDINTMIHATADARTIMRRSVKAGAQAIGAEMAALTLREDARWVVRYVYGLPVYTVGHEMRGGEKRQLQTAVRERQPHHSQQANPGLMRRWTIRSMLIVPLFIRREAVGALFLACRAPRCVFREQHMAFARKLGTSVSLALEKARMVEDLRRELSRRRATERELNQAHVHLEQRVRERTAELQASQRALTRSEEQFRQMAASVQDVFWLANATHSRILYASPAYESIWGRSLGELYKRPRAWSEAIHPADQARVRDTFLRHRTGGGRLQAEYRIIRPDGTVRWIADRGWAVRDMAGRIYRIAGLARDVTERHEMEAKILNTSEAERQRIGRDLHDSLGQSLTAIAYLASALSNSLRNRDRSLAAEARNVAALVEKAAGQAHELARGLCPIDLRRRGLVASLQDLAASTETVFGIRCRYAGLPALRLTDEDMASQLYRIAQEAVHNAARHSRSDAIQLRLTRTDGRIALSVKDSGVGLTQRSPHAEGMGLSTMRYRADMIGATLRIRSRPGRGTTVTCLLSEPTATPQTRRGGRRPAPPPATHRAHERTTS